MQLVGDRVVNLLIGQSSQINFTPAAHHIENDFRVGMAMLEIAPNQRPGRKAAAGGDAFTGSAVTGTRCTGLGVNLRSIRELVSHRDR